MNGRAGWAPGSNRASAGVFGTTESFVGGTPRDRSRSPSASLTVTTALAYAQASRSWTPSSQRPVRRLRPPKRLPKNSGIASWRSRMTGTPAGGVAGSRRRGNRAACGPGRAPYRRRACAPLRATIARTKNATYSRDVRPTTRPGGAGRRAGGRDAVDGLRSGSPGRRSANTSTGRPAAASASASRRTRGSSS